MVGPVAVSIHTLTLLWHIKSCSPTLNHRGYMFSTNSGGGHRIFYNRTWHWTNTYSDRLVNYNTKDLHHLKSIPY